MSLCKVPVDTISEYNCIKVKRHQSALAQAGLATVGLPLSPLYLQISTLATTSPQGAALRCEHPIHPACTTYHPDRRCTCHLSSGDLLALRDRNLRHVRSKSNGTMCTFRSHNYNNLLKPHCSIDFSLIRIDFVDVFTVGCVFRLFVLIPSQFRSAFIYQNPVSSDSTPDS